MMTTSETSNDELREVNSLCITTHKAALNPLIRDYQLGDTISQLSAVLAFTQSVTISGNDKDGVHLSADAVTGLFYILQIVIDTLDYIGRCNLANADSPTFLPKR